MDFLERELEDWCEANPDALLGDNGHWLGRQVAVGAGVIDLVGMRRTEIGDSSYPFSLVIVELKSVEFSCAALCQIERYAGCVDMWLYAQRQEGKVSPIYGYVEKILVATGEPNNAIQSAADSMGIELYSVKPSFSVSGRWHFNRGYLDQVEAKTATGCEELLAGWLQKEDEVASDGD